MKELFENVDLKYVKMEVKDDRLLKKFKVSELPALLFLKNGKLVGKIEGYFDIVKEKELKEKIDKIVSKPK